MKTSLIVNLLIALLMISCGPGEQELAQEKFNKAEQLYGEKQFNEAKLMIDSIIEIHSGQIEFVTRAKDLLRTITIKEQEANLQFLDSMLVAQNEALKPLMKSFTESSDYGSKPILIHKRQKPENSYGRIYLRAHLDLEGNFFISSRYTGEERIYHNHIRVYNSGKAAMSEIIEEDGINNRHFDDGEISWEVINFKNGTDNGVIDFIANNWDQPLKVQFRGKKYHYILMEKFDKEAIRDGYEISFVLKEIKRIESEISKVKKELSRLNA